MIRRITVLVLILIEKGSKEAWARKIALSWLNGSEGTGGRLRCPMTCEG